MHADKLPRMDASVECWIEGRILESVEEGQVKHRQAQNRQHCSGYDETVSRGPTFIDVRVYSGAINRSTTRRETDSPHISCKFRHPTQFLGEGEFARNRIGIFRGIHPLKSVGKLGAEECHVNGYGQKYPIAASEHVVFPGALERIPRVGVV